MAETPDEEEEIDDVEEACSEPDTPADEEIEGEPPPGDGMIDPVDPTEVDRWEKARGLGRSTRTQRSKIYHLFSNGVSRHGPMSCRTGLSTMFESHEDKW